MIEKNYIAAARDHMIKRLYGMSEKKYTRTGSCAAPI